MPELPDLAVFSSNLNKRLKGKTVRKIAMVVTDKLNVSLAVLKKTLEGQSVKKVYREGKEIHIAFSDGDVLGLHLMLNGDLYLFDGENPHKSTVLEIIFDDDTGLALTDWQRIVVVTLNPSPTDVPDALDDTINFNMLKEMLKRRTTVKKLIMEQKVIRGIGNAYADEILWEARISPFSICNKIPDDAIKELAKAIKKVLTEAIEKIQEAAPDTITGEIRDFLGVHNAQRKESPTGRKIEVEKLGGRITYFTDEQVMYG